MPACLPFAGVVAVVAFAPAACLPTAFWQITPVAGDPAAKPVRVHDRAVVLIHGLQPHPFRPSLAAVPAAHGWQKPSAELAKALASDSDVYGFSYAQTVPVDDVAHCHGLRDGVARLADAGYDELVLVGHSAGGLVARHFVERYPDGGVTKVVTVATPHAGAGLADLRIGVRKLQAPFIRSLSPKTRAAGREPTAVADAIGFCCVVCKLPRLPGDSVVGATSQWPEEFQKLGVPAAVIGVSHFDVMRDPKAVAVIAQQVRCDQCRWTPDQVAETRKTLFGVVDKK